MKKIKFILIALFTIFIFVGCGESNSIDENTEGYIKIYHINSDETKFVLQDYIINNRDSLKSSIREVLNLMSSRTEYTEYKKSIPETISIKKFNINKNNLVIDLEGDYSFLKSDREILLRASLVKTLTQLEGIESVELTVSGKPLLDKNGKEIGAMTSNIFIDGDDENYYNQYGDIILYFANETGEKLKPYEEKLVLTGNLTIEQQVLELLIKGINVDGYKNTISSDTKVLNVYVKDGICYVDLNENFNSVVNGVKDEITIYSVVNTLSELSDVIKVQFTINGKPQSLYRENIKFDELFERNLDLIESEE